MTQEKDVQYHRDAIRYNNLMADAAYKVAKEVKTKQIQHWARSIARQHREHAKKHRKALWRKEHMTTENQSNEVGELVETSSDGLMTVSPIDTVEGAAVPSIEVDDNEENLPIEEQQRRMAERLAADEQDGENA